VKMKKFGVIGICAAIVILAASFTIPAAAQDIQCPDLITYQYDGSTIPETYPNGTWAINWDYTGNADWYSDGGMLHIEGLPAPPDGEAIFYRQEASLLGAEKYAMEVRVWIEDYDQKNLETYLAFAISDGSKVAMVYPWHCRTCIVPEYPNAEIEDGYIAVNWFYHYPNVSAAGATNWSVPHTYRLVVDKSNVDPAQHIAELYVDGVLALTVPYDELAPTPGIWAGLTFPYGFAFGASRSHTIWDYVSYEVCFEELGPELDRIVDEINGLPDNAFRNNPDKHKKKASDTIDEVGRLTEEEKYAPASEMLATMYQGMDGSLTPDKFIDDMNDWIIDPEAQKDLTYDIALAILKIKDIARASDYPGIEAIEKLLDHRIDIGLIDPQPYP